jgi:hypothetical protein
MTIRTAFEQRRLPSVLNYQGSSKRTLASHGPRGLHAFSRDEHRR